MTDQGTNPFQQGDNIVIKLQLHLIVILIEGNDFLCPIVFWGKNIILLGVEISLYIRIMVTNLLEYHSISTKQVSGNVLFLALSEN